jgi:hypothetical protein
MEKAEAKYGGFLTSKLDESEWQNSCSGRFLIQNLFRHPVIKKTGGSPTNLDDTAKIKRRYQELNSGRPSNIEMIKNPAYIVSSASSTVHSYQIFT